MIVTSEMHRKLLSIFEEAVESVRPYNLIKTGLEINQKSNCIVRICDQQFDGNKSFHIFGFGKAVYSMAVAISNVLKTRIKSGVLSVPHAKYQSLPNIRIISGAHNNLPDSESLMATDEILKLVQNVPTDDVILVLISGGGSSLLCKPVSGITIHEKLLTIKCLVAAGASIHELNAIRKKLSAVKGGKFGTLLENKHFLSLILSDVIRDPLDVIASGPTVANEDSPTLAIDIVRKYKLELKIPKNALHIIKNNCDHKRDVTTSLQNYIIGNNKVAIKAVLATQLLPFHKISMSSTVQGISDLVANIYFQLTSAILEYKATDDFAAFIWKLKQWQRQNESWSITEETISELSAACQQTSDGVILVFGGETTVELHGSVGKGGRSQQLSLAFSTLCFNAQQYNKDMFQNWDAMLLCAGTDGIDGPTDAAGAIGCADVIKESQLSNILAGEYLQNNDSYTFYKNVASGKYHIITGHTGTNVMDIHMLLLYNKAIS